MLPKRKTEIPTPMITRATHSVTVTSFDPIYGQSIGESTAVVGTDNLRLKKANNAEPRPVTNRSETLNNVLIEMYTRYEKNTSLSKNNLCKPSIIIGQTGSEVVDH